MAITIFDAISLPIMWKYYYHFCRLIGANTQDSRRPFVFSFPLNEFLVYFSPKIHIFTYL